MGYCSCSLILVKFFYRQVAVKILEKASFKSEQQRLHATREARLMATLRHPNIVDVKTVMEDDYRILIVMENLTGGELFDYISNKGSLDEREARRIFQQIVLAIHYCHEVHTGHIETLCRSLVPPWQLTLTPTSLFSACLE